MKKLAIYLKNSSPVSVARIEAGYYEIGPSGELKIYNLHSLDEDGPYSSPVIRTDVATFAPGEWVFVEVVENASG